MKAVFAVAIVAASVAIAAAGPSARDRPRDDATGLVVGAPIDVAADRVRTDTLDWVTARGFNLRHPFRRDDRRYDDNSGRRYAGGGSQPG